MEKQDVLNEIKSHLESARVLAKDNANLIGNSQIHIHIGSIQNKWLGGMGTHEVMVAESQPTTQRVFQPGKDDFKKKSDIQRSRLVAEDDELAAMSLSALKMKAREMGLAISGRNKIQLIDIIKFAKRGERDTEETKPIKEKSEEE